MWSGFLFKSGIHIFWKDICLLYEVYLKLSYLEQDWKMWVWKNMEMTFLEFLKDVGIWNSSYFARTRVNECSTSDSFQSLKSISGIVRILLPVNLKKRTRLFLMWKKLSRENKPEKSRPWKIESKLYIYFSLRIFIPFTFLNLQVLNLKFSKLAIID